MLAALAVSAVACEGLRLAVELYGAGSAVLADGTAVAWIGPEPDDAQLWALLGPDEPLPLDLGWIPAAA